jgi:hypothetical protein
MYVVGVFGDTRFLAKMSACFPPTVAVVKWLSLLA